MNQENISIFRVNRTKDHPYWGHGINLPKSRENNLDEMKKEDEINNKILRDAEVEKLLYEAVAKEEKISEKDKKEAYVYKKENRYHEGEENVYISLRFGVSEDRKHWFEARISVFNGELCVFRRKTRGDQDNYYPIKDGELEESIAKAVRHPMKW